MGYETINVTPVTPRIGAEVDGLTLAKPLSNRQVEELQPGAGGASGPVLSRSAA